MSEPLDNAEAHDRAIASEREHIEYELEHDRDWILNLIVTDSNFAGDVATAIWSAMRNLDNAIDGDIGAHTYIVMDLVPVQDAIRNRARSESYDMAIRELRERGEL